MATGLEQDGPLDLTVDVLDLRKQRAAAAAVAAAAVFSHAAAADAKENGAKSATASAAAAAAAAQMLVPPFFNSAYAAAGLPFFFNAGTTPLAIHWFCSILLAINGFHLVLLGFT